MMSEQIQYAGPDPTLPPSAPKTNQVSGGPCRVINGQLPVETDCWFCRNRVITRPLRVYEKTPSWIMLYVSIFSMIIFSIVVIIMFFVLNLAEGKAEGKGGVNPAVALMVNPTEIFKAFCAFAAFVGLGLAVSANYGSKYAGEWRVVHYCPKCNKMVANLPSGNASVQTVS